MVYIIPIVVNANLGIIYYLAFIFFIKKREPFDSHPITSPDPIGR